MGNPSRLHLSRRALLFGAAASGLLAAAYASLRQVGSYPKPSQAFAQLTAKEAWVYALIGDFILPPDGLLPGSGGDALTLAGIDRFLDGLPVHHRRMVRSLPHVIEHGPALDRFGARSMSRLPEPRREAYLGGWAQADEGIEAQLWSALKLAYGIGYFGRSDVRAAMGLAPYCGVLT